MLKELRLKNDLTLLEVAIALGYKYPSSYKKIEEGKQSLKVEQIFTLSKLYKCSQKKILDSIYSK